LGVGVDPNEIGHIGGRHRHRQINRVRRNENDNLPCTLGEIEISDRSRHKTRWIFDVNKRHRRLAVSWRVSWLRCWSTGRAGGRPQCGPRGDWIVGRAVGGGRRWPRSGGLEGRGEDTTVEGFTARFNSVPSVVNDASRVRGRADSKRRELECPGDGDRRASAIGGAEDRSFTNQDFHAA